MTTPAASTTETAAPSLYARLGGYDALAAATDDLLGRLQADPQLILQRQLVDEGIARPPPVVTAAGVGLPCAPPA